MKLCLSLSESKKVIPDEKIKKLWNVNLESYFTGGTLLRKIKTGYGVDFEVFYNEKRATNYRILNKKSCPFNSFMQRRKFGIGNFIIAPNIYPFSNKHWLIISKKHISKPRLSDIKFIVKLSELIDETIILSIKGSGAGVPEHLHFQAFDKIMPVENVFDKKIAANGEVVVGRLDFPAYGIRIIGRNVARWLFRIIKKTKYPYNLIIRKGKVIFYPRTIVCPSKVENWRFGATELGGLFVTRNKDSYEELKLPEMIDGLKKATLYRSNEINEFEESVRRAIN